MKGKTSILKKGETIMSFQKKEKSVQVLSEECPVLASERKTKKDVCNYLALVSHLLFNVDEFTKDYLANMKQLSVEIELNLFEGIKKLDPNFPWDNPLCKEGTEEAEEDAPAWMYEILKESLE